jgi:biofilm protein TabA
MILDRIEHAAMYRGLEPILREALDYLSSTDFSQVPEGRHVLDGERLFALVQRYQTKAVSDALWEAHRRYIDVQYVVAGDEQIGYAPLVDGLTVTKPYDTQKDVIFFNVRGDRFELSAGTFAIFTPHDVHAPGLVSGVSQQGAEVRKVVVKCRAAA